MCKGQTDEIGFSLLRVNIDFYQRYLTERYLIERYLIERYLIERYLTEIL